MEIFTAALLPFLRYDSDFTWSFLTVFPYMNTIQPRMHLTITDSFSSLSLKTLFGFNPRRCAVLLSEYHNLGCIYRIFVLTISPVTVSLNSLVHLHQLHLFLSVLSTASTAYFFPS